MLQTKLFKTGVCLAGIIILGFLASQTWALLWLAVLLVFILFAFFYLEAAFYILIGYLPFQIALNPAAGVDLMSGRVLILALLLAWGLRVLFKKEKIAWPKSPAVAALVLFFIVSTISLLAAMEPAWGARKLLFFVSIFPLFFLTTQLIDTPARLKKLIWVLIGAAAISALLALVQFLGQFVFGAKKVFDLWNNFIAPSFFGQSFGNIVIANPSWLVRLGGQTIMRAIGLFPDPHMLSFFLGLTAPLVLAFVWQELKRRRLLLAVFCLLIGVLLLTFSRGGYMGLVASFAVMGFLGWRFLSSKVKIFISSFVFCLAVIILIMGVPVLDRFFSSFDLSEGSNAGRLAIWNQSLAQAKDNLLLGVGLGNYPLALNFNEDYRSAVTSHNLYLDILAEMGIFGLLAWLWFLAGLLGPLLKEGKGIFRRNTPLAIGLIGSLTYFCVHSIFETPIFNPTVLAFLMLIAGLSVNLEKITQSEI